MSAFSLGLLWSHFLTEVLNIAVIAKGNSAGFSAIDGGKDLLVSLIPACSFYWTENEI